MKPSTQVFQRTTHREKDKITELQKLKNTLKYSTEWCDEHNKVI